MRDIIRIQNVRASASVNSPAQIFSRISTSNSKPNASESELPITRKLIYSKVKWFIVDALFKLAIQINGGDRIESYLDK